MRWPWTSVARLDDLKEEVQWLRVRNETLSDAENRLQRFQSGMTEAPRPARRELLPMPPELVVYLDGVGNPSMKREARNGCYRRHAAGEDWASITSDILRPHIVEEEVLP